MKVLYDCIVTQSELDKCSTVAQFVTLTEQLLQHEGVFIYWPVPEFALDQIDVLPQDERIKYLPVKQSKDRVREYNRLVEGWQELLSFTGPAWDWDVLVTVRTAQVPMMKVQAVSPRHAGNRHWTKRILVIEDMLVLSDKPTVPQSAPDIQDRATLEGYLAADQVFIPAYHEKKWLLTRAKQHFSPAKQMEIRKKIKEVCHLSQLDFQLKKAAKYDGNRKFNLAFVGRLERVNARLGTISDVLTKQWVFNGDKVRSFICTVSPDGSPGEAKLDMDAIEILHPSRKEFWRIAKEEMDLAVYYHIDSELNMSMLEPISFGVPAVVKKEDWSIAMLGENYPFFVTTVGEAYGVAGMFLRDYEKSYALFAEWFEAWFIPTYKKRCSEEWLYSNLVDSIVDTSGLRPTDLSKDSETIRQLVAWGGEEFVLYDVVTKHGKDIPTLRSKVSESFDKRGLIWGTPWNDIRLTMLHHYGYEDASTKLGHLRRKS